MNHSRDWSAFGRLLFEHRKAAKLTQEALARASGVSIRALRDLERGRAHAAQQRSAEVIADALHLNDADREVFLTVAKEGRRRTPSSTEAKALCALPPSVPDFVGRSTELAALRAEVAADGAVVAIVGHPGVGKTALAVWAAHQLQPDYPDGCFAVDLGGMDEQPVAARIILDRLLRALDVSPTHIPSSETEQSNLFRTLLDGHRVLVLLDNAANESQVRPLLAAVPGCLTLITARRALAGLEAARWMRLDPLPDADAVGMLAKIAGAERVAAEPSVAEELVSLCGNLPLAVRIAGNRLASRPQWSLGYLVEQLGDERARLGSLAAGDLQVRSAFEISYRRLSEAGQQAFRRLAAVPGGDFGLELTSVVTELPASAVPDRLDELAEAGLLQPASVLGRFRLHDLIRIFAAERWRAEEDAVDRSAVRDAVLDHLLGRAVAAAKAFFPDPSVQGWPSEQVAGEWLARESVNWMAAQREAARLGRHRDVIELAKSMHWYSDTRWSELPWDDIFALGVASARVTGGARDLATLLNFLGWAQQACLHDHRSALDTHREALAVAARSGDTLEVTWAHGYLGSVLTYLGDLDQALEHARRACELGGEFGFWTVQAPLRVRLGRILMVLGRNEEAFSTVAVLLAEMPRHSTEGSAQTRRFERALTLVELGHALSALGRWHRAVQAYQDARALFTAGGQVMSDADAALHEGKAWRMIGESARARDCLEHALAVFTGPAEQSNRDSALAELALLPTD